MNGRPEARQERSGPCRPGSSEAEDRVRAAAVLTNDTTQASSVFEFTSVTALRLHYIVGDKYINDAQMIKKSTNKATKLEISRIPGKTMLKRRPPRKVGGGGRSGVRR